MHAEATVPSGGIVVNRLIRQDKDVRPHSPCCCLCSLDNRCQDQQQPMAHRPCQVELVLSGRLIIWGRGGILWLCVFGVCVFGEWKFILCMCLCFFGVTSVTSVCPPISHTFSNVDLSLFSVCTSLPLAFPSLLFCPGRPSNREKYGLRTWVGQNTPPKTAAVVWESQN